MDDIKYPEVEYMMGHQSLGFSQSERGGKLRTKLEITKVRKWKERKTPDGTI